VGDVLPRFTIETAYHRSAFLAIAEGGRELASVRFGELPDSIAREPSYRQRDMVHRILAARILAAMERANAAEASEKRLHELEDLERFAWI
jgi:hypothetical protein